MDASRSRHCFCLSKARDARAAASDANADRQILLEAAQNEVLARENEELRAQLAQSEEKRQACEAQLAELRAELGQLRLDAAELEALGKSDDALAALGGAEPAGSGSEETQETAALRAKLAESEEQLRECERKLEQALEQALKETNPKPAPSSADSGEELEAALRARLAAMAEELAVAPALLAGDRVTCTTPDDDIPEGAVGIVQGPGDEEGHLHVKFPKVEAYFPTAELRLKGERRGAAQVQEILARLAKPPVPALTTLQPCSAPKSLQPGDRVTWTDANDDIPEGTVGVVQGPSKNTPGNVLVKFPQIQGSLPLNQLWLEGSANFGHALGKLLPALGDAKMLIVSTPEHGTRSGGPPFDVPVMAGLERLANFLLQQVVPIYDFAGSASKLDCETQIPDRDLRKYCEELLPEGAEPWSEPEIIAATQWMRYWMGCVRGAIKALLLGGGANRLQGEVNVYNCLGMGGGVAFVEGSLHLFPVSIAGGSITQAEQEQLTTLIRGVIADLSTRELDLGSIHIHWLHFESLEDYLKALQGYGGIDLGGAMDSRKNFGLPGEWVDGPRNAEYDLLTGVPGATPEERRAFLLTAAAPTQAQLDRRLQKAIVCRSTERVRELLGLDAQDQPLPEGERPAMLPDRIDELFIIAAQGLNLEALKALLAAGADPHALRDDGGCALSMAVDAGGDAREAAPGAAEEVDEVIDFCARAQLGMTYAEHAASLAVGSAVTWTSKDTNIPDEQSGTIVEIREEDDSFLVQGASSGKEQYFSAAKLRLASAEEGARIAELAEERKAAEAAHVASLTVGASVTWTIESKLGEEHTGIIESEREIDGAPYRWVTGAESGEEALFEVADLRLA
eukprot:COSAG04_NODE_2018_length_4992_cov_2.675455_1_plen_854_part_00